MSVPPLAEQGGSLLQTVQQAHVSCGDLFRLPLGAHPITVVCHPALAHEVLVARPEVYAKLGGDGVQTGLGRVLGRGLLTNPDRASWLARRRLIQPAFHQGQLATLSGVILEAAKRRWGCADEVVDMGQAMMQLVREVIYPFTFSLSPEAAAQHPIEVPLALATARARQVKETRARLEAILRPLIAARREQMRQGAVHNDLLERLLAAQDADTGERMTDEQLCDELLTLFAAGLETSANALTWGCHLLATHPVVQARLHTEVAALSGAALGHAPFAKAVFNETLRLYPVIPFAPRVTLQDATLGGYDLPKGARVFVSIYSIHRHPGLWQEPERFWPERFVTHDAAAFMPFGAGGRLCVGKNLALLMGPLVLAALVQQVRLKPLPGHVVRERLAVSLSPKGGLPLLVTAR